MDEPIELFDCDALIGRPKVPLPRLEPSVDELCDEMQRLGVGRALVRHRACAEAGHETGNRLVLDETAARDGLMPVWMLAPDTLYETAPLEAVVDRMLKKGACAAWLKPSVHGYVFEPWCCGHLLGALSDRRVPVLLEWEDATGRQVHEVLTAFPDLPLVLLQPPREGRHRILYPLMEKHPSLHVVVTPTYSVYRGIEELCAEFGAERLLFGSGYPAFEGGAALCMLTYAEIGHEQRRAVAAGNIERLLREVQR